MKNEMETKRSVRKSAAQNNSGGVVPGCAAGSERKNSWPLASKYLGRIRDTSQSIDGKRIELNSCQDLVESIQSSGFEEHYNASRNTDPPFVIYMNKVVDLQIEIENDIVALANMKCEAGQMIDRLTSGNERVVLRYRYLMLLPWRTVAEKMGCSKRWALRIHDLAMGNFEEILREDEKDIGN